MTRSELTNKQKLCVPCPVCAAAIGKRCKMHSGFGRRNESHSKRKYYAMQAIEQDYVRSFSQLPLARGAVHVPSERSSRTCWLQLSVHS